jgi:carboxypeptidase family protein
MRSLARTYPLASGLPAAVVANAPVEARNVETGAAYPAANSASGNYTLSQLPAGTYEISVSVSRSRRRNLRSAPNRRSRRERRLQAVRRAQPAPAA